MIHTQKQRPKGQSMKKNPARLDVYGNIYGNMNNLIIFIANKQHNKTFLFQFHLKYIIMEALYIHCKTQKLNVEIDNWIFTNLLEHLFFTFTINFNSTSKHLNFIMKKLSKVGR